MFQPNDFKESAEPAYIKRLMLFLGRLSEDDKELIYTLVIDRDKLLNQEEPDYVTDAELDELLASC